MVRSSVTRWPPSTASVQLWLCGSSAFATNAATGCPSTTDADVAYSLDTVEFQNTQRASRSHTLTPNGSRSSIATSASTVHSGSTEPGIRERRHVQTHERTHRSGFTVPEPACCRGCGCRPAARLRAVGARAAECAQLAALVIVATAPSVPSCSRVPAIGSRASLPHAARQAMPVVCAVATVRKSTRRYRRSARPIITVTGPSHPDHPHPGRPCPRRLPVIADRVQHCHRRYPPALSRSAPR